MKLNRYLVRRNTSDVFVWTEALAKRSGLEEVYAPNAKEALTKEAMPDPRQLSLDQLERMMLHDLVIFAEVKLGLDIAQGTTKAEALDIIKAVVFTLPPGPTMDIQTESRPYPDVKQVRAARSAGDTAKVKGTKDAGADVDQHVRS